jgi:butyryl-CoA dehydrogenase
MIGRKTARDGGAVARSVLAECTKVAAELSSADDADLRRIGTELATAAHALSDVVDWVVASFGTKPRAAHAAAVPYLKLWGLVVGGWQMGRAAQIAAQRLAQAKGDASFYRGKIATARFYAQSILPHAGGLARSIAGGSEAVLALADEQF